jgi:4-diphosphocytidyl-2-C-methyl-D-erythritol kinase
LVYPDLHISTKEAYAGVAPRKRTPQVTEIIEGYDISEWKEFLFNDFEDSLFKTYPVLDHLKKQMYEAGAIYASMSGSGSSIYGIFDSHPRINFPDKYKVWSGNF